MPEIRLSKVAKRYGAVEVLHAITSIVSTLRPTPCS